MLSLGHPAMQLQRTSARFLIRRIGYPFPTARCLRRSVPFLPGVAAMERRRATLSGLRFLESLEIPRCRVRALRQPPQSEIGITPGGRRAVPAKLSRSLPPLSNSRVDGTASLPRNQSAQFRPFSRVASAEPSAARLGKRRDQIRWVKQWSEARTGAYERPVLRSEPCNNRQRASWHEIRHNARATRVRPNRSYEFHQSPRPARGPGRSKDRQCRTRFLRRCGGQSSPPLRLAGPRELAK